MMMDNFKKYIAAAKIFGIFDSKPRKFWPWASEENSYARRQTEDFICSFSVENYFMIMALCYTPR
jgi:hypothetical protein